MESLVCRVKAGEEACAGLLYLHHQKPPIVHRDIKPENLLVGAGGQVKVCDFGMSRDMSQTRMQTQHMGGSLLYIAPEVHRGQPFDTGCDVYAMALVVWELLTLERPFSDAAEHMLPGLVGWGGHRPPMTALLQVVDAARPLHHNLHHQEEDNKDKEAMKLKGGMLRPCIDAIEAAWLQDAALRPCLTHLHYALGQALELVADKSFAPLTSPKSLLP